MMTKGEQQLLTTTMRPVKPTFSSVVPFGCTMLANWLKAKLELPTTMTVKPKEIKDIYSDESWLAKAYNTDHNGANVPVVLDTGASFSLTPFMNDFVGPIWPSPIGSLQGVSPANIAGIGTVEVIWAIRTEAYYVPEASIWLFSPQVYFQENGDKGECIIKARKAMIKMPNGTRLKFPYNFHNNLPLMVIDEVGHKTAGLSCHELGILTEPTIMESYLLVLDQVNQNITSAQKELLLWHQRLGHARFQWNQSLMVKPLDAPPVIETKHAMTRNSKTENLFCTACAMAKMGQRHCTRQTKPAQFEDAVLCTSDLTPSNKVSIAWLPITVIPLRITGSVTGKRSFGSNTLVSGVTNGLATTPKIAKNLPANYCRVKSVPETSM
jgi:GAG-pre-integrase domain